MNKLTSFVVKTFLIQCVNVWLRLEPPVWSPAVPGKLVQRLLWIHWLESLSPACNYSMQLKIRQSFRRPTCSDTFQEKTNNCAIWTRLKSSHTGSHIRSEGYIRLMAINERDNWPTSMFQFCRPENSWIRQCIFPHWYKTTANRTQPRHLYDQ